MRECSVVMERVRGERSTRRTHGRVVSGCVYSVYTSVTFNSGIIVKVRKIPERVDRDDDVANVHVDVVLRACVKGKGGAGSPFLQPSHVQPLHTGYATTLHHADLLAHVGDVVRSTTPSSTRTSMYMWVMLLMIDCSSSFSSNIMSKTALNCTMVQRRPVTVNTASAREVY